jgi:lipoic acid synthetase
MEVLIPDMRGDTALLDIIADAEPEIISHNMETVRRLTPIIRRVAEYERSLGVLKYLADRGVKTKSGIMLGLGETRDEILETMDDLLSVGCEIMTIGQYLQPSKAHYPVQDYIHPDVFAEYAQIGKEKGFRHIESSPMVRSSYHAEKHLL